MLIYTLRTSYMTHPMMPAIKLIANMKRYVYPTLEFFKK